MTKAALRALADALSSGTHYVESPELHETMMRAAAYMRACADAQPVAWVDVTDSYEGPYIFRGKELLPAGRHDLYTHPAPAAPQAMKDANVWKQIVPDDEPQAEPKLGELMREQRNSRIVAGAYPDGNPNAGAIMAQTSQAEPKRPAFLDEIDRAKEHVASWPQWMKDATVSAAATLPATGPKREPLSDWRIGELHRQWLANPETVTIADLMRAVERAHGIGGSDAE